MIGLWPADAAPLLVGCEREERGAAFAWQRLPNGRAPLLTVVIAEDLGALDADEDLLRGLGLVSVAMEPQHDLVAAERCLAVPEPAIEAHAPARNIQAMAASEALVDERRDLHRSGGRGDRAKSLKTAAGTELGKFAVYRHSILDPQRTLCSVFSRAG